MYKNGVIFITQRTIYYLRILLLFNINKMKLYNDFFQGRQKFKSTAIMPIAKVISIFAVVRNCIYFIYPS
jgi:hypothetical protein